MNLLSETLQFLEKNRRSEADILYVCGESFKFTWDNFKRIAENADYDNGYGSQKVAEDLMIVGKDFSMKRFEHHGFECWEFIGYPILRDLSFRDVTALTVDQAVANGEFVTCGWESLASINGFE